MNRRLAKKLCKKWRRGNYQIRDSWRRVSEAKRKAVGKWNPSNARYPIQRFTLSDLKFEIHDDTTGLMRLADFPLIRGPRDQSLANIVEVDDSKFVHFVELAPPDPKLLLFENYQYLKEIYERPESAVVVIAGRASAKSAWPSSTRMLEQIEHMHRQQEMVLLDVYRPGPLCKCGHSCSNHRELKESGNFIKHGGCEIWKVNGTECECTSFWPKDEPLPAVIPLSAQIPKDWLK